MPRFILLPAVRWAQARGYHKNRVPVVSASASVSVFFAVLLSAATTSRSMAQTKPGPGPGPAPASTPVPSAPAPAPQIPELPLPLRGIPPQPSGKPNVGPGSWSTNPPAPDSHPEITLPPGKAVMPPLPEDPLAQPPPSSSGQLFPEPLPRGKGQSRMDQGLFVPSRRHPLPDGKAPVRSDGEAHGEEDEFEVRVGLEGEDNLTDAERHIRALTLPYPGTPLSAVEFAGLSVNHRITLTAKEGNRPLGEISILTAAVSIELQGNLVSGEEGAPSIGVTLSGMLREPGPGGDFTADYSLSCRTTSTSASSVGRRVVTPGNGPQVQIPMPLQMEAQAATGTGSLRIKPGKSYEILKSSGVTYSITITPEPESEAGAESEAHGAAKH